MYQSHSETSRMGAETVRNIKNKQIDRIIELIRCNGWYGATGREIAYELGIPIGTVSARLVDISKMDWERIKRSSEIRNKGYVWKAAEFVSEQPPSKRDRIKQAQELINTLRVNATLGELAMLNQIAQVLK